MNQNRLLVLLNIILFLNSCSAAKESFSNQKKNNTDEFLIEKKTSLVIPPNYGELPKPSSDKKNNDLKENKIRELISGNENIEADTKKETNKNLKQSLLEKIKKN